MPSGYDPTGDNRFSEKDHAQVKMQTAGLAKFGRCEIMGLARVETVDCSPGRAHPPRLSRPPAEIAPPPPRPPRPARANRPPPALLRRTHITRRPCWLRAPSAMLSSEKIGPI